MLVYPRVFSLASCGSSAFISIIPRHPPEHSMRPRECTLFPAAAQAHVGEKYRFGTITAINRRKGIFHAYDGPPYLLGAHGIRTAGRIARIPG